MMSLRPIDQRLGDFHFLGQVHARTRAIARRRAAWCRKIRIGRGVELVSWNSWEVKCVKVKLKEFVKTMQTNLPISGVDSL